ncbi:hypothetical protein KEM52_000371 [Ascosphaera acerosa]|nr:hypothetical protein KEM52_000371 [Ascosphaera acerosa]
MQRSTDRTGDSNVYLGADDNGSGSGGSTPAAHGSTTRSSIDWSQIEASAFSDRGSERRQPANIGRLRTQRLEAMSDQAFRLGLAGLNSARQEGGTTDTDTPDVAATEESNSRAETTRTAGDADDDDDDDDDDTYSLPSIQDLRENRFLGDPSKWLRTTHEERAIADAIDRGRAMNLAAHLYNAFVLDKRAKEQEEEQGQPRPNGREDATEQGSDAAAAAMANGSQATSTGIGSNAPGFKTGRPWTAWPMPAAVVPRAMEECERDADDRFSVAARADPRPSAVLEGCLMDRMLKVAKERWRARKWECDVKTETTGRGAGSRHGSQTPGTDAGAGDAESGGGEDGRSVAMSEPETEDGDSIVSDEEEEEEEEEGETVLRPVVQADDDKSYELLQPAARQVLSRVDDLLLALHRARASYASLISEERERTGHRGPTRQPQRPRAKAEVQLRRKMMRPASHADGSSSGGSGGSDSDGTDDQGHARTRPRHAREKSAQRKSLAVLGEEARVLSGSEDDGEYAASESASVTQEVLSEEDSEVSDSTEDSMDDDDDDEGPIQLSRGAKLGLRDWSDVLGTAMLVGFPRDAVYRAAARCSRLFGEDMAFRTFAPGRLRTRKRPIRGRRYEVEHDDDESDSEYEYEYTEDAPDAAELGRWKWRRVRAADAGQASGAGSSVARAAPERKVLCPVAGCARSEAGNGFSRTWNLNQHLGRMHPGVVAVQGSKPPVVQADQAPAPAPAPAASVSVSVSVSRQ